MALSAIPRSWIHTWLKPLYTWLDEVRTAINGGAGGLLSTSLVTNGGAGNDGKVPILDGNGKLAGRVLETDGAKLDRLAGGTATLVAGVTAAIALVDPTTKFIVVSPRDQNTATLTAKYSALVADRNDGADTFKITALVGAGTINNADVSLVDWIALG